MGLRGPPPTPTAILRARGSWLADKRKNEPKAPRGRPICPGWLNPEAKKTWRAILPLLDSMGVLTKLDGIALARYCALVARWRKENDFIERHGSTYPVKRNGEVLFKMFPSVKIFDLLSTQLLRLEQSFGMSPSSRSRIALLVPEERSVEDEYKRSFLSVG